MVRCRLKDEGLAPGSCATETPEGLKVACEATLRWREGRPERLIETIHLSRPEHYLSIYQSGCNMSCRKCHSWRFTQRATGRWLGPEEIAEAALRYAREVTVFEPRERATAFHAESGLWDTNTQECPTADFNTVNSYFSQPSVLDTHAQEWTVKECRTGTYTGTWAFRKSNGAFPPAGVLCKKREKNRTTCGR